MPNRPSQRITVLASLVFVVVVGAAALVVSVIGSDTSSGARVESESLPIEGAPLARNIYADAGPNMLSPAVSGMPYRIYVPNSEGSSLDVIDPADPAGPKVIARFPVGLNPQHVVPAWDLQTLYVTNNQGNSLTPVDPRTGQPSGPTIPVDDPYNMYFTPDGKQAIVVAEALNRLDFRDAHTFALRRSLPLTCNGVDHMDFAADGSYLIASCEFSGDLVKVDLQHETVAGYLHVGGKPQDVKVDPAGVIFYVADMVHNGLHEIDAASFTKVGFLPTGPEAHALYPSRDARFLYVSNRGGIDNRGSVSVVDFTTRAVVATWPIPPPSTPDMGGVSPDGRMLWLAGRRTNEVYGLDTADGKVVARIKVGAGPHGLCVWPQPGRYSLGHTGILR